MKKILISFTAFSLATTSLTPFSTNKENKIEEPYKITEKDFVYTYNFKNLNFNSCNWELDDKGHNTCTLQSDDFTKTLQDLISEIFNFVLAERFATVEYTVTSINSSFNSQTSSIKSEPDKFTEAIKIPDKTIDSMEKVIVESQSVTFERSYNPYTGYTYYVNSINAVIKNDTEKHDVQLYGIPSYFTIPSIENLNTTFTNVFHFELVLVIDLTYTDKTYDSNVKLPDYLPFQLPSQILSFFNKTENQEDKKLILDYINNKLSISIEHIDKITKIYKANYDFEKNQYYPDNENISDVKELYTEPYFYLGITSSQEAKGEFKILVENTIGESTL